MPGGFVRIADDVDARAVSLQHGGSHRRRLGAVGKAGRRDDAAADARSASPSGAPTGVLPSRAADNLFWVGRYVERAEATLRLVRALINRVTEPTRRRRRSLRASADLLAAWSAGPNDIPHAKAMLIARAALHPRRDSKARCRISPPRRARRRR